MPLSVLLLSPYDARSHRYWREGVVAHLPQHTFHVHTLPPRYFSWRFRGNALTWSATAFESCDLILATSMTDLSALKGMNRSLANVPAALYFHENQFVYPSTEPQAHLVERQVTSLYSALAADVIAFNSSFNRDTFLAGVVGLLKRLPDGIPKGVVETLAARSRVLPVPLGAECFEPSPPRTPPGDMLQIVWNHRWEYDKRPDRLAALVSVLAAGSCRFRLHILGGDPAKPHPDVEKAAIELRQHGALGQYGELAARADYLALLRQADVVLSTTAHEFQGLAVLEAVACGCLPCVPDRLAYPGLFAPEFRYPGSDDVASEAQACANLVCKLAQGASTPPDVSQLRWSEQVPAWEQFLQAGLA